MDTFMPPTEPCGVAGSRDELAERRNQVTTRRTPDLGWRMQAYMLEEGTYEFDVEAVEVHDAAGYVLRLRVVGGPLDGHRILVKEASPIAGLRAAMMSGAQFKIKATISKLQGRGRRFVNAAVV